MLYESFGWRETRGYEYGPQWWGCVTEASTQPLCLHKNLKREKKGFKWEKKDDKIAFMEFLAADEFFKSYLIFFLPVEHLMPGLSRSETNGVLHYRLICQFILEWIIVWSINHQKTSITNILGHNDKDLIKCFVRPTVPNPKIFSLL